MKQRDYVRHLLDLYGYNRVAVIAGLATGLRTRLVDWAHNQSRYTPEGYARQVWSDGHRSDGPWILNYCRSHNIPVR